MKKHIWYESRFWVMLYAFVVLVFMAAQFMLGVLQNLQITVNNYTINSFINGELDLPITALSWGWTCLLALYVGSDRIVDIAKTTKLTTGQMSMGDLSKLRGMIVLSLFLLLVAVVFSMLTDKSYDLNAWATAFATSVVFYVSGNKGVKIASQFNAKIDANKDGIPDQAYDAYQKWRRLQLKNDADISVLTFDDFLDDPANIEWEKKYRPSSVKENE